MFQQDMEPSLFEMVVCCEGFGNASLAHNVNRSTIGKTPSFVRSLFEKPDCHSQEAFRVRNHEYFTVCMSTVPDFRDFNACLCPGAAGIIKKLN